MNLFNEFAPPIREHVRAARRFARHASAARLVGFDQPSEDDGPRDDLDRL